MDADGKATFAIVQAEDELAAVGMVLGAAWAGARSMTATAGPGISLMSEFTGLGYYVGSSGSDLGCAAGWPVDRVADAHCARRSLVDGVSIAWRHEARAAVPGIAGRVL